MEKIVNSVANLFLFFSKSTNTGIGARLDVRLLDYRSHAAEQRRASNRLSWGGGGGGGAALNMWICVTMGSRACHCGHTGKKWDRSSYSSRHSGLDTGLECTNVYRSADFSNKEKIFWKQCKF